MSMSCAPSSEPNVGCRFLIPIWKVTVEPELITVKPFSENESGANVGDPSEFVAVGYAYVPGPLPPPGAGAALSTTVPGTNRSVIVKMASLVEPPSAEVAATSTEFVPGCRLTVAENAPEEPAVTVVMDVEGAPTPGAVPVTAMST